MFGAQGNASAYTPLALIRLTRALMPDYRQGTQQDAHEYMRLLLSAWAEDSGLNPKDFMQSKAYASFAGCYSQLCRCLTCGEESRKYSADLDLSVEIMQFVEETVPAPLALLLAARVIIFLQKGWDVFHDLDECFRSYFKRSKMVGDNQVRINVHFAVLLIIYFIPSHYTSGFVPIAKINATASMEWPFTPHRHSCVSI